MNTDEKLSKLSSLSEQSLREQLLLPLMSRMGFKSVMLNHGSLERGKDIVCFDVNRLGEREYIAVVAKATDLDGNVSSPNSLQALVHQIEQCFDVEYCDLFGKKRITMDRVFVVTSRRITNGAQETVFGRLEKSNLSKMVNFVSGAQLAALLDEHFPAYWDATAEPIEVLREHRERLLQFARTLLVSLGANLSSIDATLNEVMVSSVPVRIAAPPDRSISHLSPYGVEIDKIAPEHAHSFCPRYSSRSIQDTFYEAKRYLMFSITEVEEMIERYEKVVAIEDPTEFVKQFDVQLERRYSFSRLPFEWVSNAVKSIGQLEEGLNDVEPLRQRLQQIGKLEWAASVVDSLPELAPEIEVFLHEVDQELFTLKWHIETGNETGKVRLVYEQDALQQEGSFTTKHSHLIRSFVGDESRTITPEDVLDAVRLWVREYFDALLASHALQNED